MREQDQIRQIIFSHLSLLMLHEFRIGSSARVTYYTFLERQALIGVVRRPFLAIESSIDIEQGIEWGDGPIAAQGKMGARLFQGRGASAPKTSAGASVAAGSSVGAGCSGM